MSRPRCCTILIEGPDRLGKSTQTSLLTKYFRFHGHKVTFVKSPFNDKITYPLIYWMLNAGWARVFPNLFQVIQFINKLIFQWFKLPWLLRGNDFIIFDRWNISMWAYGLPDGANAWLTERMFRFIKEPDYTVIMDGDPHIMTGGDSYESDLAYQRRVRSLYLNWVVQHPCCVGQVNANQPVQKVFDDILKYLYEHSGVMKERKNVEGNRIQA